MVNESNPRHPHAPEVPPVLDEEGACLVCRVLWLEGERDAYKDRAERAESLVRVLGEALEATRPHLFHTNGCPRFAPDWIDSDPCTCGLMPELFAQLQPALAAYRAFLTSPEQENKR